MGIPSTFSRPRKVVLGSFSSLFFKLRMIKDASSARDWPAPGARASHKSPRPVAPVGPADAESECIWLGANVYLDEQVPVISPCQRSTMNVPGPAAWITYVSFAPFAQHHHAAVSRPEGAMCKDFLLGDLECADRPCQIQPLGGALSKPSMPNTGIASMLAC